MIETMHRLRELKLDGMYHALQALQDMGDSSLATLWSILARLDEAEAEFCRQTLLITGPTGAGKSYLASALGHHACLQG